jgi:ATP-dependent exoDNAse (exonuclease V) beta subunit
VIVCELDHLSHEQAQNEIYVAYSRAKNHLVVVGAREKMEV